MRRIVSVATCVCALAGLLSTPGHALVNEFEQQQQGKAGDASGTVTKSAEKVPWRGSYFEYTNGLGMRTFFDDLTYDPLYTQSLSFQPRYWIRDDLRLGMRLDLEVELTTSNELQRREWYTSDLSLAATYAPKWAKIPVADVSVRGGLTLYFPTSPYSRYQTMMLAMAPGLTFSRSFDLMKGRFLKKLTLTYGFRVVKYFHEFKQAQLDERDPDAAAVDLRAGTTTDLNDPSNIHSGALNKSWRFSNVLTASLAIMDKLTFAAAIGIRNDLVHKLSEEEFVTDVDGNTRVVLGESSMNHRGSNVSQLDLTYETFDWLYLSLGVLSLAPHLKPDSDGYYAPFFNRYSTFYFNVTIPVDRMVAQVQTWTGWGE